MPVISLFRSIAIQRLCKGKKPPSFTLSEDFLGKKMLKEEDFLYHFQDIKPRQKTKIRLKRNKSFLEECPFSAALED